MIAVLNFHLKRNHMRKTASIGKKVKDQDRLEDTPVQTIITISFIVLLLTFSGILFYFVLHSN